MAASPIQLPLPLGGRAAPTFDDFLVGDNVAVLAHLRGLQMPGAPVYLWGPPGCGKSHLLQALAGGVRRAGQLACDFEPGRVLPADATLALIDDAETLDDAAQADAFRWFVDAATAGVQIAAAGRLPPVDLPLREDLRTRLGWGPTFAVQPLGEAQVRAVLRREADRRGIFLADEVMDYVMARFTRDLRHLMQLLDHLDRFALARSRHVTVPLVRQMLDENLPL
ncbi:HdaA/DnaA family protein [Rubrivivax albus]|uniref:DnaA regulatory inactivator Hda n=1 Tax=Rubrivivax albus TaxID=2499835 RepID=A0A3S2TN93_9BURK|nr:DnaA/Hda family protein [Rubrivivax albus]RVT48809.1 DnaA regulatory inactivator Hda [Rubrivivax albus]